MRIDFRRHRFIVSLSRRDVARLLIGGQPLTSIDVSVDGLPAEGHAVTLRVEEDAVHYETQPEPLPPAVETFGSWLFRVAEQALENPEQWLGWPMLAFGSEGDLLELRDHRPIFVSLDRYASNVVLFHVDSVSVHMQALCDCGEPRIVCGLGDELRVWSHLSDVVLKGDEARRLMRPDDRRRGL